MSGSNLLSPQRVEAMLAELFKRQHERPGDVFMNTLEREGLVVAPGGYNAMGGHIAKEIYGRRKTSGRPCSYNAFYFGGWSVSAMNWRRPDMGFHDRTMMALMAKYAIAAAYPLPTITDAETGFGPEISIAELVEIYHQLGVAVLHEEDQETKVRRCGNMIGKEVIPEDEMVAKIFATLVACKTIGTSMRLMVRTDALTAADGGIEKAIERGKRYMDVDYQGLRPAMLWVDAIHKPEDLERWVTEMHRHDPKMVLGINYSPNKDWTGYYRKNFQKDPPTYDELYANGQGFRVIWHTILQARADMEATWNTFEDMAENGAKALWDLHERQRNHPVGDSQAMSGAKEWQAYEQFIGGEAAQARYKKSEGYKG